MLSFGRRMFVSSALVACLFAASAGEAEAKPQLSSSLTGRRLGRTRSGEEVKVTREVGSGFLNPWQAAAAARMTGSEAVLVLGRDGKWHACATSANAYGGITPADDTDVRALRPLASPKGLAGLRTTMNEHAYVALVLGLEEKDVKRQSSSGGRQSGFVNVTRGLPTAGAHGPERSGSDDFLANARTAIELDRDFVVNDDPRKVGAALFHETIHLADYTLAQRWAGAYQRGGGQLMQDPKFQEPFENWLGRRVSKEDAQMISDTVVKRNGATEARAYIGTFIMAINAGAGDVAQEMLVTYVNRAGRAIPVPAEGPVLDDLRSDLDKARRGLDAKGRGDFDRAMRAAKAANPKFWIFERGANRRS